MFAADNIPLVGHWGLAIIDDSTTDSAQLLKRSLKAGRLETMLDVGAGEGAEYGLIDASLVEVEPLDGAVAIRL